MWLIPKAKEDTDRKLIKRYTKGWIITLLLCGVLFIWLLWFENSDDRTAIYTKVAEWLKLSGKENGILSEKFLEKVRNLLADDMANLIVTIGTIMAAAVTFFYSIQDNRRGGIPYRSILVYKNGSWTIPTLFVLILLMLVANQVFVLLDWYWMLLAGIVFCLVMNLSIICVILFSASIRHGIKVITRAEIKQFNHYIKKAEKEKKKAEKKSGKEEAKDTERERKIMGKHCDAYQKQHLVYVAKSEEVDVAKMQFIRNLLFVPYCSKKYNQIKKRRKKKKYMPEEEFILLGHMYDYYYENLQEVFSVLKDEERDKAYEVLYKFVEYIHNKEGKHRTEYVIVSAIMNAALMCGVEDAEFFCNHLLINSIKDEETRKKQIGLYILFHEYLYWANPKAVMLKNIKVLRDYCLEWSAERCLDVMYEAWKVWFYNSTLPWEVRARLLCNVIETIKGMNSKSISTFYMMRQLNILGNREG